ncbi:hypothetical protein AOA01_00265 [Listeria monocytogenes]|uniref:hypothetical protein n=1 Tax=Listeria monocytogenes TaxID=1639 RepID=UPI000775D525|nr:hypothetical protein [Listeria monocytogenes]EAF5877612.1 hypothetical protein [Listeria monocytogenes]KXS65763.1 hypothetical protein AWJ02_01530 [Listeria monocytogenes]KXW92918.1 hypothetical protein AWJ00_08285 [Listeria monocytogenes]
MDQKPYKIHGKVRLKIGMGVFENELDGSCITIHDQNFAICPTIIVGLPCVLILDVETRKRIFTLFFDKEEFNFFCGR